MEKIFYAIAFIAFVAFILGLVSQKGEAKGLVDGKLAEPGTSPNVVSSEDDVQPELAVQALKGRLPQIKEAIIVTGGTITSDSDSYLSATYMSKIFKYVDDVEIRKESDILWHIRSASRVGYSDMGVNRKRVEAIRAAL